MKIIACYKSVPADPINVNRDRTLDLQNVTWEVGKYDLTAVETAMTLAGKTEGHVIALTAGGEIVSNSKMKKTILSRGPDEMLGVQDDKLASSDSFTTAEVLKNAILKAGDVDLVFCGEGSGDMYAQQVGPLVGAMLGWNTVNAVSKIEYQEDGSVNVERVVADGIESLNVKLPAVISVVSDICSPRVPSMKDIMKAGKKPATVWTMDDLGQSLEAAAETVSVLAPEPAPRKQIVVEGTGDEAMDAFVEYIKKSL